MGMLTVGNMMSMVTKGKVDVTDTVGKVVYRQFKQVCGELFFLVDFSESANNLNKKESFGKRNVCLYYFVPKKDKVLSLCMSVCLSTHLTRKLYGQSSPYIVRHLWPWICPPLMAL